MSSARIQAGLRAQRALDRDTIRSWLIRHGGGDPESVEITHVGFNVIARVGHEGAVRNLRVNATRDAVEIEAALAYLGHVHAAGAPVCAPLAWPDGQLVQTIEHAGTTFRATLVEHVHGRPVERHVRDVEAHRAWGLAMAKLHRAAGTITLDGEHAFHHWADQLEAIRSRIAMSDPAESRELVAIESWLAGRPTTPDRFGLTHGDMNAGNAIWDGERVVLIDFEEPCWHWWAADLARPLRELEHLTQGERRTLREALVGGYTALRPLPVDEVSDLGWHVRLKDLDILTWRREVPGADSDD